MIPAFIFLVYTIKNFKKQFFILSILGIFFGGLFVISELYGETPSNVFSSGTVNENINIKNTFRNIIIAIGYLVYNFWYFLLFLPLGFRNIYGKSPFLFIFLTASLIPIFGFSCIFGVSDNYVYFIPFNYIIAIFIGIGVFSLKNKKLAKTISFSCLLIPAFYLLSLKTISYIPQGIAFHETKKYKGGLKYYLIPWMHNNVGILEFTIDKKKAPERIDWMTKSAEELIKIKSYYQSYEQIRTL